MSVSLGYIGNGNDEDSPNMGNRNAGDFFAFIGVDLNNGYGSIGVDEMIERCAAAIARVSAFPGLDEGVSTSETIAPGGCTWIECGRDTDYLLRRSEDTLRFAREAKAAGAAEIYWS